MKWLKRGEGPPPPLNPNKGTVDLNQIIKIKNFDEQKLFYSNLSVKNKIENSGIKITLFLKILQTAKPNRAFFSGKFLKPNTFLKEIGKFGEFSPYFILFILDLSWFNL